MLKRFFKILIFIIAITIVLTSSGCFSVEKYHIQIFREYYFTMESNPDLDIIVYDDIIIDEEGNEYYTIVDYKISPSAYVDTTKVGKQTFTINITGSFEKFTVDVWVLQFEEGMYCRKADDILYCNPIYLNSDGQIYDSNDLFKKGISNKYEIWKIGDYSYLDGDDFVTIDSDVYMLSEIITEENQYSSSDFCFTIENNKIVPLPEYKKIDKPIFVKFANESIEMVYIFDNTNESITQEQIDAISRYGVLSSTYDTLTPVNVGMDTKEIDCLYIIYDQVEYIDVPFLGDFYLEDQTETTAYITFTKNSVSFNNDGMFNCNYKATENTDTWIIDIYGMVFEYDKATDTIIGDKGTEYEYKLIRK